jgi:hypothetical protein
VDPQAHPRPALSRRHLQHRHRAQGRPDLGLHPHRPPRHRDRAQGRRGGPPAQGRRALHEEARRREGRGHEPSGQRVAARDRCRPARAGRRRAARRPRGVPPRHATRRPDRHASRRHGGQGAGRRPSGRHRDVAARVVPRGPGAAAHAPRQGRLRHGRSEDDVRRDRREGVGLPRRPDPRPRAGDRTRARASPCGHARSRRRASADRPPSAAPAEAAPASAIAVAEPPAVEEPVVEVPVAETPAEPAAAIEAPAPEAPAAETADETPSGDDA